MHGYISMNAYIVLVKNEYIPLLNNYLYYTLPRYPVRHRAVYGKMKLAKEPLLLFLLFFVIGKDYRCNFA